MNTTNLTHAFLLMRHFTILSVMAVKLLPRQAQVRNSIKLQTLCLHLCCLAVILEVFPHHFQSLWIIVCTKISNESNYYQASLPITILSLLLPINPLLWERSLVKSKMSTQGIATFSPTFSRRCIQMPALFERAYAQDNNGLDSLQHFCQFIVCRPALDYQYIPPVHAHSM